MRLRVSLPIKLMVSYLLIAALITLPAYVALRVSLLETLEHAEHRDLLARARVLAQQLRGLAGDELRVHVHDLGRVLDARITMIAAAGVVSADSSVETVDNFENHAARPEVVRARRTGEGVDVRTSATLGVKLVYVAVPLEVDNRMGTIVRLATRQARVAETVSDALIALRVGVGIGVSAALLLSLVGALYLTRPMRRLRDVARAYAKADWVEVKRGSNDELGDLADALDQLGGQLRQQLVAVGAAEALVLQAVESLATPAALLDESFAPITINGSLRARAELSPDIEETVMGEVRAELTAMIAGTGDVETVALHTLSRGTIGKAERFHVAPLARPDAKPLWLLLLERDGRVIPAVVQSAVAAVAEAEQAVVHRGTALDELRHRIDALVAVTAHDTGPPTTVRVDDSIRRAIAELGDGGRFDVPDLPDLVVIDRHGLVVRAIRLFLGLALRARGDAVSIAVVVENDHVELRVAAAPDLMPLAPLMRLLGGSAGSEQAANREAAWLILRRA